MRLKKAKRVLALVMAALMVVGLIPITNLGLNIAKGAGKSYELKGTDVGGKAEANKEGIGTDKYFTLNATAAKAVDYESKAKSFEDGKSYEYVLKMGSGNTYNERSIMFTVADGATATVDVYGVASGGKEADGNYTNVALYSANGTLVSSVKVVAGKTPVTKFENLKAGTYYVTDIKTANDTAAYKGLNIYGVTVTENVSAPKVKDYLLQGTDVGGKAEANKEGIGTDKYFTLNATAAKAVDYESKAKSFEDGKSYEYVLKMGSGNTYNERSIMFTVADGATATVDVYGVASGGKEADGNYTNVALYSANGTLVSSVKVVAGKTPVTKFENLKAGTYYVTDIKTANDTAAYKGLNIYAVSVTETTGGTVEKKPWAEVPAPAIGTIKAENGTITVPFTMVIGSQGADTVTITMKDSTGKEITSSTSRVTDGSVKFNPSASGDYTFSISAQRKEEEDKVGADVEFKGFVYPLGKSAISLIYNKGNGTASVEWSAVKEATSYVVEYSADGTTWESKDAADALTTEVSGLKVGTEYSFRIVAKRGDETTTSDAVKLKITNEAQQAWGYLNYGNGAGSNGKYSGSVNEDGKVTLTAGSWTLNTVDNTWSAKNNNGKWVPASFDGLGFYYTAVPASKNFTLRAKVTVNEWFLSNAQEAFGLIANDKLGGSGWNNSYAAYISKNEYYWNAADGEVTTDTSATKVTQKIGIGSQEKIGVTKDNIGKIEANDSDTIKADFKATTYPLEQRYPESANIIGNAANTDANPSITEMYLSIQKNNTGYFVTYESVDGSYKMTKKYYNTKALEELDSDNVYVGFFLARYGNVTFSDITFTTIDPADDAPAEERPVEKIAVNTAVESPSATGVKSYELAFSANCDGTLTIYDSNNKAVAENVAVKANKTVKPATTELSIGKNNYKFVFTPDKNYVPGEYQVMESYEPIEIKHTVTYAVYGKEGQSLWVAPDAKGNGTKANPMSIYDAVKYVQPGQTIVLMGGTYNLDKTVKVERGIDGTADKKIYMVADPDASERPVLDFGGNCAGMVLAGDYWVFRGFDVTKSADAQKGIQVSGNYNLLDNVNAYRNGNTGIQISRYLTTDEYENWPAYNTILNCSSYYNADKGFEDADGFAAKLTVGDGNVFDGCIAHHNADDGWDLFAKVQSGSIGSVTIKNSVAYANGYTEAGGEAGNGNGFKMGGDSMPGKHLLQNCVAYDNKAKGIDSNSCPDIIVKDCVTYNNGSYNVAFYTNTATNTDFSADNVISFRTKGTDIAEQLKFVGSQKTDKVYKDTNYFWDTTAQKSLNKSGAEATADWFESLDTSVVPTRNADGTINMKGLLKVTDKAPEVMRNAGLTVSTASGATVVPPSIVAEDIKTGDTTPIALYIILAVASMAVLAGAVIVGKKRTVK